jgi:hypothetical protein
MSSALRFHGAIDKTTRFQHIRTQSYYDSILGATVPIPFSYSNNTLDINIQYNVEDDLITNADPGNPYANYTVQTLGGDGLVLRLGPNMIRWLNDWVSDYYNSSVIDTFTVLHPGVMTKIQTPLENNDDTGDTLDNYINSDTYGITDVAPSGENHVNGDSTSNYLTSWIFKTPLTIKFMLDGSPRYLTYASTYAPQND